MLEQRRYSNKDYDEMFMFAMQRDNLFAAAEVRDHEQYFDNLVEVVKGRKVPHGTRGVVFYLSAVHYSQSIYSGRDTRVGIKTDTGEKFFTSLGNVKLYREAAL